MDPLGAAVALTAFVVNICPNLRVEAKYSGVTLVVFMPQSVVDAVVGTHASSPGTHVTNAVSSQEILLLLVISRFSLTDCVCLQKAGWGREHRSNRKEMSVKFKHEHKDVVGAQPGVLKSAEEAVRAHFESFGAYVGEVANSFQFNGTDKDVFVGVTDGLEVDVLEEGAEGSPGIRLSRLRESKIHRPR